MTSTAEPEQPEQQPEPATGQEDQAAPDADQAAGEDGPDGEATE